MKMTMLRFTITVAAAGVLAACGSSQDASQQPVRSLTSSDVAAVVNGEQISIVQVQHHAAQRGSGDAPADSAAATQELINLLLLSQEATRQGLDEQPAVLEELARQKYAVLANALIEKQVGDMPIEEADLRAEYAIQTASMDDQEYLARHILLSEQAQADEVVKQLRLGADFGELARRESTGPSARQGGDLGWFRPRPDGTGVLGSLAAHAGRGSQQTREDQIRLACDSIAGQACSDPAGLRDHQTAPDNHRAQ